MAHGGFGCEYRQYLTDEQEIKVNQGAIEHITATVDVHRSAMIEKFRGHIDCGEAELNNPVLRWLDEMEDVEFFDANAYLSCKCGEKAMHGHLEFRHMHEPGYNPTQFAHDAPTPRFLGNEALEQDRLCNAEDNDSLSPITKSVRSQAIFQIYDIHTIPSNNLWILGGDCADDANKLLVGAIGGLPAPRFMNLTRFPARLPHSARALGG